MTAPAAPCFWRSPTCCCWRWWRSASRSRSAFATASTRRSEARRRVRQTSSRRARPSSSTRVTGRPSSASSTPPRRRSGAGDRRRLEPGSCSPTAPGTAELGTDFSTRPEIDAALSGSTYQEARHSDTLNADILATAVPILERGQHRRRRSDHPERRRGQRRRPEVGRRDRPARAGGARPRCHRRRPDRARIARPIGRLADAADEVAAGRPRRAGADRGHDRAAAAGPELQRDDRSGRADASGASGSSSPTPHTSSALR